MKKTALVARLVLGLPLLVFGLNGFLGFLDPPQPAAEGQAFIAALMDSGYLWELKNTIEVLAGAMILTGAWLPLGLVLIAPIVVNIVGFHLFLDDPINGAMGYLMLVAGLVLAWIYLPSFDGVLNPRGRTRWVS